MKISKYTFLFHIENTDFYLYNTLSNALLEIDEESYKKILDIKTESKDINLIEFDKDLYEVLCINNFFTENEDDDFLRYKSIITRQRNQKGFMHLTLAPTMDCCFSCHYCFEKYKDKAHMNPEVMDSIVKYIMSFKELESIKITWFGGEPLMAPKEIEMFYKKLIEVYDKTIDSNIITTGYHICEETIEVMKSVKISSVQITLDGMKENHNKVKYIDECDDVFSKVIDNIELLLKKAPEISIVVRVNLTKGNSHEYIQLHDYLKNRFSKYNNLRISPAFVLDRGASNVTGDNKNQLLFTHKEKSEYLLNLTQIYGIDNPYIRYPERFFTECAIRNDMAISFDAVGNAYKCWEIIGNKEYSIGRLNSDGTIIDFNETVYNRHTYGADPIEDEKCKKCNYLPICNGGCPIQRIENKFENGCNITCTHYNGFLVDFLKIHLALKKAGFENK